MQRYILSRLIQSLLILFGVLLIVFFMLQLTGDPVSLMVSRNATPEQVERVREEMGFNRPLVVQFADFMAGAVVGDFGMSLRHRQPAMKMILERLPATVELATVALLMAMTIGIPLGLGTEAAKQRTIDLLDDVGIPGAASRYRNYPHQFSGGMRQRVMIAIACNPRIVIADEPTTALDVTVQAQIVELTKRLQKKRGMTVVWITHDLGVVAGIADRVLVMYAGCPVEIAPVDDLYESPRHPYTQGLLAALPRLDDRSRRDLASIEGAPPDMMTPPRHCQFAWRCLYTFDRCWEAVPPHYPVGEGHTTQWFYDMENGRPRTDG